MIILKSWNVSVFSVLMTIIFLLGCMWAVCKESFGYCNLHIGISWGKRSENIFMSITDPVLYHLLIETLKSIGCSPSLPLSLSASFSCSQTNTLAISLENIIFILSTFNNFCGLKQPLYIIKQLANQIWYSKKMKFPRIFKNWTSF